MPAKLKRPESYIGHGVFVFQDGYDYPVKRQISNIEVRFCRANEKLWKIAVGENRVWGK